MKHLKILHLEDNAMKQTAIARVLHDVCEAEIDWVMDVASGMKKIEEIKEQGDMYDLAITDMQYPLKKVLDRRRCRGSIYWSDEGSKCGNSYHSVFQYAAEDTGSLWMRVVS